jgi:hypothetical protein
MLSEESFYACITYVNITNLSFFFQIFFVCFSGIEFYTLTRFLPFGIKVEEACKILIRNHKGRDRI